MAWSLAAAMASYASLPGRPQTRDNINEAVREITRDRANERETGTIIQAVGEVTRESAGEHEHTLVHGKHRQSRYVPQCAAALVR